MFSPRPRGASRAARTRRLSLLAVSASARPPLSTRGACRRLAAAATWQLGALLDEPHSAQLKADVQLVRSENSALRSQNLALAAKLHAAEKKIVAFEAQLGIAASHAAQTLTRPRQFSSRAKTCRK